MRGKGWTKQKFILRFRRESGEKVRWTTNTTAEAQRDKDRDR